MKRFGMMMLCITVCIPSLHADYQKGSHTLSLNVGGVGYGRDFDINRGDNRLRNKGGVGGFQYLYYMHSAPTLGLGVDLSWANFSDRHSSSFLANSESTADTHNAMYQLVAKLAYPSGHFRPYLLGGIGVVRSSLQSYITPGTGMAWTDTQTSETRQTFDSVEHGAVWTWGLGFDWFFGERIFLGAELRESFLPQSLHQPTAFGQSQGITPVRDPDSLAGILLKIGYKFGA